MSSRFVRDYLKKSLPHNSLVSGSSPSCPIHSTLAVNRIEAHHANDYFAERAGVVLGRFDTPCLFYIYNLNFT